MMHSFRKVKRILSDSDSDPPTGAAIFSEKLLGLRDECSACGEWENSTGWLFYREGDGFRWYVELKCTGCGSRGVTWKREWLPLIEEVLTAVTTACAACAGDGECSACKGAGVDVGVAVMGGSEVNCERCGGLGTCPVCGGSGEALEDEAGSETH
jgi:hypothetical protein